MLHNASEDSEFYLKIVNQYKDDILVYMDAPPARKDEKSQWTSWDGPTKTQRGEVQPGEPKDDSDPWVPRITIAPNRNPN